MSRKVKMVLVQPEIKCAGRDDVVCHYRGRVVEESEDGMLIKFRHKGQTIERWYGPNGFEEPELADIKVV